MNRRQFLAWLGGTAAGTAFAMTHDVERMLWLPGKTIIEVPGLWTPGGFQWLTRDNLLAGRRAVHDLGILATPNELRLDDFVSLDWRPKARMD